MCFWQLWSLWSFLFWFGLVFTGLLHFQMNSRFRLSMYAEVEARNSTGIPPNLYINWGSTAIVRIWVLDFFQFTWVFLNFCQVRFVIFNEQVLHFCHKESGSIFWCLLTACKPYSALCPFSPTSGQTDMSCVLPLALVGSSSHVQKYSPQSHLWPLKNTAQSSSPAL